MNQTIYDPIHAVRLDSTRARHVESLLSKIWARLRDSVKGYRVVSARRSKPLTFIEVNLLDETMGPEIRRTLRI